MNTPTPIGICIYCGNIEVKLTDEHIIPKGFGNDAGDILHEASCDNCSKITSGFELTMLRENLQPVRTVLQMKSRHHKPHQTIEQHVKYADGRLSTVNVPYDQYRGMFAMPIFHPPSFLKNDLTQTSQTVDELQTFYIGNSTNDDWYRKQGIVEYHVAAFKSNKDQSFARFFLKISYCAAVKYFGYERVKNSPVRELIIGNNKHIAVWFGNIRKNYFHTPAEKNSLARYAVDQIEGGRLLVSVQLFPLFDDAPTYHTII
jgi:hypothetical protein